MNITLRWKIVDGEAYVDGVDIYNMLQATGYSEKNLEVFRRSKKQVEEDNA